MALTKVSRGLLTTSIVDNGNATAITIDSNENVGVGTSSTYNMRTTIAGAGSALSTGTGSYAVASIYDTATAAAGTGGGLAFQGDDGTNSAVTFATVNGSKENATAGNYASYLGFSTRANGGNLTEKVRIDSAGNVGIGTSSPRSILDLDGGSETQLRLQTTNTGSASSDGLLLSLDSSANAQAYLWNYENAAMIFGTNATERMRLNSAGLVGINNPNPAQTLSICNPANPNRNGMEIAIGAGDTSSNTIQNYNRATGAYTPLNIVGSILTFGSGGGAVERMRIAADGSISIPNQNAINELSFTGTDFTNVLSATTSGFNFGTTGAGYLAFITTNSEKVRILPTGGITFNGDTAQANALDDYEEGTWTPVMTGLGTGGGTYLGYYTKTGRVVHWSAYFAFPSTSDSSFIVITGLPYASLGGQGTTGDTSVAYQDTLAAGLPSSMFLINQSTATLYAYAENTANQAVYAQASGRSFYIGGSYITA